MVIGSGPIVIGQACEFDYSGTQACRVLMEEGYRVVLANSNPATIMTDPGTADRTYIEPLDAAVLTAIIEKERPDALLPTLGGQTALNLTMQLVELGVLERYGVEVIGARPDAISTAEDRDRFKAAMQEIGLEVPPSGFAHTLSEAEEIAQDIGFPIMVRPSFILGGSGTGIARDAAHFTQLAVEGLAASPVGQILVERSIAGWKEFELEVMRDAADNCVVVCSIENVDPMGVHTGDSITVAPAQTLTDVEYQADARRRVRLPAARGCGDRRVQRAVRRRSADGSPGDHRDEPEGLALVGPGLEGHRVPHRQDRRPPGRRVPPRRDPQRHHPGHARLVRTDDRLRGDQGAALGLREAARDRRPPGHPHAVGRGGDGHRAHVLRVAAEGVALARAGARRPQCRPGRGGAGRPRRPAAARSGVGGHARSHLRGRSGVAAGGAGGRRRRTHRHRSVVRPADGAHQRGARPDRRGRPARSRRLPAGQTAGVLRRPAGLPPGLHPGHRSARAARPGRAGDVQDRGHLRGGVRGLHPLPLLDLRGRGRGPALRAGPGRHPRLGPQPHRPGHRVRLLLRPCVPGACGRPATRPS